MDSSNIPLTADGGGVDSQVEDILRFVRDSRKFLLVSVLLSLALAKLFLFVAEPSYRADALVQIEDTTPSLGAVITQVQNVFDVATKVGDEKEIIGSRSVLIPVVDELHLQNSAVPMYFPVIGKGIAKRAPGLGRRLRQLPSLRKFAWSDESLTLGTLMVPASMENKKLVLTAGADGGYTLQTERGTKLGEGKVGEPLKEELADGSFELFVQQIVGAPGTRFEVVKKGKYKSTRELDDQLTVVEVTRGSNLLRVSVEDTSPDGAANKANRIANYYLRQNVERRSEEAQKTLEFLKQEIPEIHDKLRRAEDELQRFRSTRGSIDIEHETGLLLEQSSALELQRLTLTQKKAEMSQRFTGQHPELLSLNEQIAQVDRKLDKLKGNASGLPELQQKILRLTLDAKVQNEFYVSLLSNIQQLEVAKAGKIGNVRIIDLALPPLVQYFPKPLLIYAAATAAGLILGFVGATALLLLNTKERDPVEIERILGVPVFAQIPLSKATRRSADGTVSAQRGSLLALRVPDDPAVESLRSLRASLHFGSIGAANNCVMLTGPSPGVGKTFITANLGLLLAASGKKVLLIDTDMRRGRLHAYFDLGRSPGLSDLLAGTADHANAIRAVEGGKMDCITSGEIPPNPAELLLHDTFGALLETVSPQYDYVLIDSAPILAVADAGIVGARAGTTLVVVKSGGHGRRELDQMMRTLGQAGARVRGAVINQVTRSGSSYGYYYQYEYYRDDSRKA